MLPKPKRPEYSTTIPSTGKKIKYMPFSVKEEKVLIIAAESQDPDEITNGIINVLSTCITSPTDFKVDELALFDIEYLFLKTRAKSAGEKIKLKITDPSDDSYSVNYEINIDKIGVKKNEDHKQIIQLDETISVKMKYPDVTFFNEGIALDGIENSIKVISRCVDSIIVGEEVYNRNDMEDGELNEWVEGLSTENLTLIMEFFQTMPKLRHEITLKNRNTGNDFTVTLEGLADFF